VVQRCPDATDTAGGRTGRTARTLYWDMSLWGNYNVVLMQTDLPPFKTVEV
jgi:hypothetical protein